MGADGLSAQSCHPLRQVPERGYGEVCPAEEEHGCKVPTGTILLPSSYVLATVQRLQPTLILYCSSSLTILLNCLSTHSNILYRYYNSLCTNCRHIVDIILSVLDCTTFPWYTLSMDKPSTLSQWWSPQYPGPVL